MTSLLHVQGAHSTKFQIIKTNFLLVSSKKLEFMVQTFYLDGYKLPNHGRQSVLANGSMVIENAHKLHDEGFYTCTARNQHDDSHSGTVQIEVLSK